MHIRLQCVCRNTHMTQTSHLLKDGEHICPAIWHTLSIPILVHPPYFVYNYLWIFIQWHSSAVLAFFALPHIGENSHWVLGGQPMCMAMNSMHYTSYSQVSQTCNRKVAPWIDPTITITPLRHLYIELSNGQIDWERWCAAAPLTTVLTSVPCGNVRHHFARQ